MRTALCERLGIEFPLFAFSHCRDVVAAVSRAGGFGVLGAVRMAPEELELELRWIDAHVDGRPYGVDVLIPENIGVRGESGFDAGAFASQVPAQHREFVRGLLARHGVAGGGEPRHAGHVPFMADVAEGLLDGAFSHPIRLIANAWESEESPGALPMPLQSLLSEPALHLALREAEKGNERARELVTYFVGQGVGLIDSVKSCRQVVQEFMEDFADAASELGALVQE